MPLELETTAETLMFWVGREAKFTIEPLIRGIRLCPPVSLFAIAKEVTTGAPDGGGVGDGLGAEGVEEGVGLPGVGLGVGEGAVTTSSLEKLLSTPRPV